MSVIRGITNSPVRFVVRTRMAAHRPVRTAAWTPAGCFWCAHTPRLVSRAPRSECRSKCRLGEAVGYQLSAVSRQPHGINREVAKSAKSLRCTPTSEFRLPTRRHSRLAPQASGLTPQASSLPRDMARFGPKNRHKARRIQGLTGDVAGEVTRSSRHASRMQNAKCRVQNERGILRFLV